MFFFPRIGLNLQQILLGLAFFAMTCVRTSHAEQINGKLLEWGPTEVRFEAEGGQGVKVVNVNARTHVRVYARGSREFLVPMVTLAVYGIVTPDGVIKSGRGNMPFDGEVMVYVYGTPPASKSPPSDVIRLGAEKQVQLIATPISADPLIVQGIHEYSDPALAVPRAMGGLSAVSTMAKKFSVEPSRDDFVVLHLGNRIDLAGPGSQVKAFVPDSGPPLANLLIIERAAPYTPAQLGFKPPVPMKDRRKKNVGKNNQ